MRRSEMLNEMSRNWPRMSSASLDLIDRRTRAFSDEEFAKGVEWCLENLTYPPTVSDVFGACNKLRPKIGKGRREHRFKPGDEVYGEKTFTPAEARAELERLHEVKPSAFDDARPIQWNLATVEQKRAWFEHMIDRIYVAGLRRCAALDSNRAIVAAHQRNLF